MIEQLIKGAIVLVGKGKTVGPVDPSPSAELAKLSVKVNTGLVVLLILALYQTRSCCLSSSVQTGITAMWRLSV